MSRSPLTLALLPALLWMCVPRAAAASKGGAEAESLRPLAVDLRRLYPRLEGRWRGIDDNVFSHRGGVYRPAMGFLAAPSLPPSADGAFVITSGGVRVERRLLGAAHAPAVVEKGLLRYPAAFPQTEALYVAGGAAERFFLLTDPSAPTSFEERLRVSGGRLGPDAGGLAVYDARGEARVRLPAPRVLDSEGRARAASWRVSGGKRGVYTVRVGFDPAGLEYPLLLVQ